MGILAAFIVPHPLVIIPDIGQGKEKMIQKTADAYQRVAKKIGELQPETIILISPHQTMYADYFHISPGEKAKGNLSQYHASHVKMRVSYDTEFVEQLCSTVCTDDVPAGTLGEKKRRLDHGAIVPLYFINQYWAEYNLVRVGISELPFVKHYELGQSIRKTVDAMNRNVVVIASGDLSRRLSAESPYGYSGEGAAYDQRMMDVLGRAAFGELLDFPDEFCEKAGECGHRAFCILAGMFDRSSVKAEIVSYEDVFGVGCGICGYTLCKEDSERNFKDQYEVRERNRVRQEIAREDEYVKLARRTIETHVRTGGKLELPENLPAEMYHHSGGVFVSVKEDGTLRGCVGTIEAACPSVAEEIIENAVSASLRDPRFPPIEPYELDKLTVSVDVLGEIQRIGSPEELDVKRYGVLVTKGHKKGLLLPNLEGVDTVEEQIRLAKQRAEIDVDAEVGLERFEVVRHF